MNGLIHYDGFIVSVNSRTYQFHVTGPLRELREFTLTIPLEAFRTAQFKFQDGPDICFARLRRELDGETEDLHAETHMVILALDIQEYSDRRHPRKNHLNRFPLKRSAASKKEL